MNICVYGASSNTIDPSYLAAGEALGEYLAEKKHAVIFGGGADGMMGAVARGMRRQRGVLIGIAPSFFRVGGVLFTDCTEFIYTDTMRERKKLLEDKSDAFLVTPGSIGTYDEFFEVLSLRQLGRIAKPIALYNINNYFSPLLCMLDEAVEKGFMKAANRSLYTCVDTPEAAVEYFENYHPIHANMKDITDFR